eukprot:CAMPEP_0119343068 /NCGR_PEP_ID=MMETSP1333-20130426/106060_1 /TAXON_ID=418940 /ORGANISM="Scyphosphaera apsteinii, Strain RCC1455" /LENGTH=97 /DNA_ID=CAMNT_0007355419 /DNA_START=1 /DNA_END=291 /DNA_ORIENTATION=+
MSITRRQDRPSTWQKVKFVVFDAHQAPGGICERLQVARGALQGGASCVELLKHDTCRGVEHVRSRLKEVEALKGEGLMLRHPTAPHRAGRSAELLKV